MSDPPLFENDAVYQPPDNGAVGKCIENIRAGMLLDKGGRNADKDCEGKHDPVELVPAEGGRVQRGGVQRHGADHMHAWKHVRIGVGGVNVPDEPGRNVMMLKGQRPQILSVREDHVENNDGNEAEADESGKALEVLCIPEKKIHRRAGQKRHPQAVGNDKPLTEGNEIVQRDMNGIIIRCDDLFRDHIENEISGPDGDHPKVAVIIDGSYFRKAMVPSAHKRRSPLNTW